MIFGQYITMAVSPAIAFLIVSFYSHLDPYFGVASYLHVIAIGKAIMIPTPGKYSRPLQRCAPRRSS